jgi:hypothetical protein
MSLKAAFRRARRWLLKDPRRAFARAALIFERIHAALLHARR